MLCRLCDAMGWPCWNSMEYHWRLVKCPEALQRSCSAGISGRILRCARCGHLNLRKMTLMIWSEAPKSTSWSTLKRWPAGGWKDGKKVLTTFVAKLSFKDNWTRIIVFDFVHSPIAQFILSIWGIGDGFLTPRCWSYFALKLRKQSAHGGGSSVSSPAWRWTRRPNWNCLCFF